MLYQGLMPNNVMLYIVSLLYIYPGDYISGTWALGFRLNCHNGQLHTFPIVLHLSPNT